MTVELNRIVNVFDMHLEGKVHDPSNTVRACTNILNKASLGMIDPREGMNEFYQVMNVFFSDFVRENYKFIAKDTPNAIKKVWEYQLEGTFRGANTDYTAINADYLYMLLRLRPEEIKQVKKNPKLLKQHYLKLQDEIYTSKPVISKKIRQG